MPEQPHDATSLLATIAAGSGAGDSAADADGSAADRLFGLVYEDLKALATSFLRSERNDHTLQPTALVHEAYLRLIDQTRATMRDRNHFMAIAGTVMRRVLIDHARAHLAEKRGGGRKAITLDANFTPANDGAIDILALEEALTALAAEDGRAARVVELRFFAGLTATETADLLDVGKTTVDRDWAMARAWLSRELRGRTSG